MNGSIKKAGKKVLTACALLFVYGAVANEAADSTTSSLAESTARNYAHGKDLVQCMEELTDKELEAKNLATQEIEGITSSYRDFIDVCNQDLNITFLSRPFIQVDFNDADTHPRVWIEIEISRYFIGVDRNSMYLICRIKMGDKNRVCVVMGGPALYNRQPNNFNSL